MNGLKVVAIASCFLFVGAISALADVEASGTVTKEKTVNVEEVINIKKNLSVDVTLDVVGEKAAEAHAVLNQSQRGNFACENCAEKTSEVVGSILNNAGIVNLNQATGNMANQSNMLSAAVDGPINGGTPNGNGEPPAEGYGFAHAQTSVGQLMEGNTIDSIQILYRDAVITGSINTNTGIVMVNQSVGNISNQGNGLTLGVSFSGLVALAEADLGQAVAGNSFMEYDTTKTATISGSINENVGVVEVNQSAGVLGNQLNAVNISGSVYGM